MIKYLFILVILAVGGYFYFASQSGKRAESAPSATTQPAAPSAPENSELAWLTKVEGKPLKTQEIMQLRNSYQTQNLSYLFKANDMLSVQPPQELEKARKAKRMSFRIIGSLYTGPKGTTLKPSYDGNATVFIIDVEKQKMVNKVTKPLRSYCYT